MKKNIKILTTGIDVGGILKEINDNPADWLFDTKRQNKWYQQQHTQSIPLVKAHGDDPNSYKPTPLYDHYPETLRTLKAFYPVGLSRINIVKLTAGMRVYPHFDHGKYYETRNRYHLTVTGVYEYTVGDEIQLTQPGILFWFDNKQVHSSFNNSQNDRISVIFDVEK